MTFGYPVCLETWRAQMNWSAKKRMKMTTRGTDILSYTN
ncbi:hypothetical protein A306_00000148 [Columba livia]|uniref:Uncharacterized protein n=1 Tax=Columba livia TaxID=8932 RepID=A0A2I0MF87_COLLI|nr:hypothetical protein A306_00000148 [Columba livia]